MAVAYPTAIGALLIAGYGLLAQLPHSQMTEGFFPSGSMCLGYLGTSCQDLFFAVHSALHDSSREGRQLRPYVRRSPAAMNDEKLKTTIAGTGIRRTEEGLLMMIRPNAEMTRSP